MNKIEEIEMLALFMGHDGQHEDWCGNNILIDDDFSETGKNMIPYNPDKNWSQLMEIVRKIDNLQLFDSPEYRDLAECGIFCEIDVIYDYVVEFVGSYNNS